MELALSLGNRGVESNSVGYCMGSSRLTAEKEEDDDQREINGGNSSSSSDPSRLQLDLLPLSPVPRSIQPPPPLRFPWLTDNLSSEPGSSDGPGSKIMEPNRRPAVETTPEEVEEQSSPNSGTSSFMEFSLYTSNSNKRGNENNNNNYGQEMIGATTSKGSDDEENGSTRKKLRLSKEQSAFLEESFKEHHTLNPKQKLALAKQLNLRPRQVEVWFQNRRARTKLKQTEVDCEYLKRCCETLTEENRRLQKELQELRALKTSQPFYMQLPATTLTMCPSCERVAPTSTTTTSTATVAAPAPAPATPTSVVAKPTTAVTVTTNSTTAASGDNTSTNNGDDNIVTLSLGKPKVAMLPFSNGKAHQAAS